MEALRHFGISFSLVTDLDEDRLESIHVLLLVGRTELDSISIATLKRWTERGGHLVVSGSLMGLEGVLGLTAPITSIAYGTLKPTSPSHFWPADTARAKCLSAVTAQAESCTVLGAIGEDRPILTTRPSGSGSATYFGVHLGVTASIIQQGTPVERNGVGSMDGSIVLDDGVLKVEDGIALDFDRDRFRINDSTPPFFALPSADVVREVWIRCIIQALQATGRAYAIVWPWPNHADAVSLWTVDVKHTEFDAFQRIQHLADSVGMHLAWLASSPGLPAEFYRYMRRARGEAGALSGNYWDEQAADRIRMDYLAVTRASATGDLQAVRPESGAWQGWLKYYEALSETSAKLSVAKGSRQAGATGFSFGTCHPFRPIAFSGSAYPLWEVPFVGFVPGMPNGIGESILQTVQRRHGCFHIAGNLDMVQHTEQESQFRHLMTLARQAHITSLRPTELVTALTGQRSLRVSTRKEANGATMSITSPIEMERLSILIGGAFIESSAIGGRAREGQHFVRFGVPFVGLTLDLEAKMPEAIRLVGASRLAA